MAAHTDRGTGTTRALRRALRREVPCTVGLLTDEQDFAAMRRYGSFPFDDHDTYLRVTDAVLADLARATLHTSVALFDPGEFAAHCERRGLDPDSAAGRTHYTASIVAGGGVSVAHAGLPVRTLVTLLVDTAVRKATWEYATAVLADLGPCAECGDDIGSTAFDHAAQLLARLLDRAGEGYHQLVCSVPVAGEQLVAVLGADGARRAGRGATAVLDSAEGAEFATVLGVGIALAGPGGVVMRTTRDGTPDLLHGWHLRGGRLAPLTAAEVFNAYCTDADTGEPVGPESGVDYRAGFDLGPHTGFPH